LYAEYFGYYQAPGSQDALTLRYENGRLLAYVPERLPTEWFPESESIFFVKGSPGRYVFHRDERGAVDYFTFRWE
jgi:hypothetical protein